MVPDNSYDSEELTSDFEITNFPSLTYKLNENDRIIGRCDGKTALEQAIYKLLSTERYENMIYSWFHGVELQDLRGADKDTVFAELEDRIYDALIQDDRIEDVIDFEMKVMGKNKLEVSFTVISIFEDLQVRREVDL